MEAFRNTPQIFLNSISYRRFMFQPAVFSHILLSHNEKNL